MRGKVTFASALHKGHRITPRVCGEKQKKSPTGLVTRGSPPHVRGKVTGPQQIGSTQRITPACAGKSALDCARLLAASGSPPHVRGKVCLLALPCCCRRITPACAGKRRTHRETALSSKDHPRMCGEKLHPHQCHFHYRGSPPHVRGKVSGFCTTLHPLGITPACAGKSKTVKPKIDKKIGSPPHVRGKD